MGPPPPHPHAPPAPYPGAPPPFPYYGGMPPAYGGMPPPYAGPPPPGPAGPAGFGMHAMSSFNQWRENRGKKPSNTGTATAEGGRSWSEQELERSRQITTDEIMEHCAERVKLRERRDFRRSDEIRNKLLREGVKIVDADGRWYTADGREGPTEALPGCQLDDRQAADLQTAWVAAKRARDFVEADRIRDKLRKAGLRTDEDRLRREAAQY